MPRLTLDQRNQAIGMLRAGTSQIRVAQHFNVHPSTITRLMSRYRNTGGVNDRPRPGVQRVTTARQDHYIVTQHLRNRFQTAAQTANNTIGTTGRQISSRTVRRRLAAAGIRARRPYQGQILTQRHRLARQRWAAGGGFLGNRVWRNVVFSDESRFNVSFPDGRDRVYRRRGERFAQPCVIERDRYGGGGVMVWGAINAHFRSQLVIVQGNLTARRYTDTVLQPVLLPLWRQHGGNRLVFQHDNARPHTAILTQNFLRDSNVDVMQWPSRSPDMNPIEHLWDELGRRVRHQQNPPTNVAELTQALQHHWNAIPIRVIRRLCDSMPRRLQACVRAQGGHTRY